jgi:hypothetical protein
MEDAVLNGYQSFDSEYYTGILTDAYPKCPDPNRPESCTVDEVLRFSVNA